MSVGWARMHAYRVRSGRGYSIQLVLLFWPCIFMMAPSFALKLLQCAATGLHCTKVSPVPALDRGKHKIIGHKMRPKGQNLRSIHAIPKDDR